VLSYFEGSLTRALVGLFPEVSFDESKFLIVPSMPFYFCCHSVLLCSLFSPHSFSNLFITGAFWKELKNRKKVFDRFAKENKFDPLIADNWYSIGYRSMADASKGISSVLQYYYGNNLKKALLHVYPNIGLDKNKFNAKYNWTNIANRRAYLIDFAKSRGFDPLVFDNWNYVTASALKNTANLLQYYNGSLTAALHDLFSDTSRKTQGEYLQK